MIKHELRTIEVDSKTLSKLKIYVFHDLKCLFCQLLEYIENVEHNIKHQKIKTGWFLLSLLKIYVIFLIEKKHYGKFERYREAHKKRKNEIS